jgi:hypothetical protein
VTLTRQEIRYRANTLDPTDTRPEPSVKWWARLCADTAESVEFAANQDDYAAVGRRIKMLQRNLDYLRENLDRVSVMDDGCGKGAQCEGRCFT